MKHLPEYDYIITGAGCAGLSLAVHLIQSGKFRDKKILLIDQDFKKSNDRTWCFWEENEGLFQPVVYRSWRKLWFHGEGWSKEMDVAPYMYKMIRGIDFYEYCLELIRSQPNFTIRFDKVDHIFSTDLTTGIRVGDETIHANYIFNSILFEKPELTEKQYWLLQHFKGWTIETDTRVFDPSVATLMDFRVSQQWGTAFCYVLPFSDTKALVEYTLFSGTLLSDEQYKEGLQTYLGNYLGTTAYKILDEEFGVIPMTNFKFAPRKNHIFNIGTAGGQTKGSSGYTFNFIQKHSKALVDALIRNGTPYMQKQPVRFSFYDSVLLHILDRRTLSGKSIFTDLFKKNQPSSVLRFLDNESTPGEELKIISTLPTMPFMKAAIYQLFY